jgi:TonB family protein
MASPAKITEVLPDTLPQDEVLPDTLPQDFDEWDGAGPAPTQPVHPANLEPGPGFGVVPKPATRPAAPPGAVTPSGNPLGGTTSSALAAESLANATFHHAVRSSSPAWDPSHKTVGQRQAAAPAVDQFPISAPRPNGTTAAPAQETTPAPQAAAMTADAYEILLQSIRASTAETTEPKSDKRMWPIIVGTSAPLVVILAAVMIPLLHHRTTSSVKPAGAAPKPMMTVIRQPASTPAAAMQTAPVPTQPKAAAGDARDSSDATPAASNPNNAGPSRAQAEMMSDQLKAPARIHLAAASAEPSGGFAAADMVGSGNNEAINSVFSSANQPTIGAAPVKIINVSSGVALGLLIQKTIPVYPPVAKTSGISGTVVLSAIISKNGIVEQQRVVSGPLMLRQAAIDAVRTWRYRPYKLDNQPTAIQTTIRVIFSLSN